MVLGRGFAPRSPVLQAGAFTRLAFRAHQCVHAVLMQMVRAPVIETRSSEWHSDARPSSYARMVGNGRNRTSCPKGPRLQRSDGTSLSLLAFPGVGCSGSNRTTYLVGMSHANCQCSTLRQRLRGLNSLACAAVHPCVRRIGGSLTCRSPCLSALIRFERRPEAAPVRLPKMAEGCELESHTREGVSRFPSGAGAPARLIFQIGGERAQSKPMPFPAPSVFKTAPATWPVHSPCWSSRQESNLHPSPSEGGAHPIELRDAEWRMALTAEPAALRRAMR